MSLPPEEIQALDETVKISQTLPRDKVVRYQRTKTPVVFIHGLWLHASSWRPWVEYFNAAGYQATAPGWPDFPSTVEETRKHPEFMLDQTIDQVVDHYTKIVRKLPQQPVVIGHSFGGLVAQRLLDRRLVAAVVAIDPAPIKGVRALPFTQFKAAWPVLSHPGAVHKAVILNSKQFRYGFANQLDDGEAKVLYRTWSIPAPARPLWQAALAAFTRHAQTKVDTTKKHPPLLLMSGQQDHTVPPETTRDVHALYRDSASVTDLKEWPDRGHSLVIDSGWKELADYALKWLRSQHIR